MKGYCRFLRSLRHCPALLALAMERRRNVCGIKIMAEPYDLSVPQRKGHHPVAPVEAARRDHTPARSAFDLNVSPIRDDGRIGQIIDLQHIQDLAEKGGHFDPAMPGHRP